MAELYALQEILPKVRDLGGSIVALTPQTVARSKVQLEKKPLEIDLLTDFENNYANKLGIRFQLPDYLVELYQGFGLDLPDFHGEASWTLPMPARIAVGADGVVIDVEVSADYTHRPEPEETFKALLAGINES
ncbi:MAG: hypothetical protein ACR2PZ_19335 [Pseudomonadales bacterium]